MDRKSFQALCAKKIVILDGAMGTELQKKGLPSGACPESFAAEHPAVLAGIHKAYAMAGADIVYTCSFGANRPKLDHFGLGDTVYALNQRLAEIARQAVSGTGKPVLVAGDLAPTGQLIHPLGDLLFEEAVAVYKEQVRGLLAGGVDLFVVETMMHIQEARAALLAVRESCDLPVMVSITLEPNGKMLTGTDPVTALVTLQSLGADAVGLNCSTGPDAMADHLAQMRLYARVPLFAKANAGLPIFADGVTQYSMAAVPFADAAKALAVCGANLIGGCCGTTPAFIEATAKRVAAVSPAAVAAARRSVLTSAAKTVDISGARKTLLIGERINPTGKKALQQALLSGDCGYVSDMAARQKADGADLLDVNLGMGGIDEAKMMAAVTNALSFSVDLPLCIDSSDPKTIAAALRVYPGRALVNSVSLERRKIEEILPVAARYGAMLLVLPLSDGGIPDTAAERQDIVRRVYEAASAYGYQKEDMVVDGLVMTVSAEQQSVQTTLDTIAWCESVFGVRTVIGLSNVSFGLPQRSAINAAFLSAAVFNGLTMMIGNPADSVVTQAKDAADVLRGKDENALHYISRYANQPQEKAAAQKMPVHKKEGVPVQTTTTPVQSETAEAPAESNAGKAYQAVVKGATDGIIPLVRSALEDGVAAKTLVEDYLIPAITKVGDLYEAQQYFLPQLVLSAKAMETAFDYLQPYLTATGTEQPQKVKIVIATVRGDIHDIGKNIVKLMLKNNGFAVVDLGKDVPAELIVRTALAENADIVGLSALMTTTMAEMGEVIRLLREAGARCKVMVGGAVITDGYAAQIGADAYSPDAANAVRTVKKLMGAGS